MKKLIYSILMATTLFSCSITPATLDKSSIIKINATQSTQSNEVTDKLKSILEKNGKLADEDINISVYSSVSNAVVGINTTSIEKGIFSSTYVKGTGSGVIISKDGYILTNYHVVENSTKLQVILSNKKNYTAKLIGKDKNNDVALIKITADSSEFGVATLGDSTNLVVGQKVLAIGNPYGLSGTLTTGIISSLNRNLPTEDGYILKDIIQTDAAINPGNSGGPLINAKGEIIGINTAIFSPSGGSVGIGFAIPINKIKDILKDVKI